MFSGVLIADEVGVGIKGSGNSLTVDVQTHLEIFFSMSLRSACFADEVFF